MTLRRGCRARVRRSLARTRARSECEDEDPYRHCGDHEHEDSVERKATASPRGFDRTVRSTRSFRSARSARYGRHDRGPVHVGRDGPGVRGEPLGGPGVRKGLLLGGGEERGPTPLRCQLSGVATPKICPGVLLHELGMPIGRAGVAPCRRRVLRVSSFGRRAGQSEAANEAPFGALGHVGIAPRADRHPVLSARSRHAG